MEIRVLAAAAAALAIALAGPALAAKQADKKTAKPAAEKSVPAVVAVDVPPPSGSWEATPPPNADYVWSAGYHKWVDGHYEWTPGEWVLKKEGMSYRQHKWSQRADGKWVLTGGDWVSSASVAGNR